MGEAVAFTMSTQRSAAGRGMAFGVDAGYRYSG